MTLIERADTTSELLVAATFIMGFFLGVANGQVDSNMSALLVAGIGSIMDFFSEKFKSILDPTAKIEEVEN